MISTQSLERSQIIFDKQSQIPNLWTWISPNVKWIMFLNNQQFISKVNTISPDYKILLHLKR